MPIYDDVWVDWPSVARAAMWFIGVPLFLVATVGAAGAFLWEILSK